jgi:uncharacterized membrane protein
MDTRRAEAFSDGVFAVAITVLVFGLLPIGARSGAGLGGDLARNWPTYVAYVVSFLTIGIMWLNHHTLMAQMKRVNRSLLVLNLLLLMGVVAVPFPTALVADHLTGSQVAGGPAAAVTYGLVMIAISVAFSAMWLYVGNHASEVAHRPGRPVPRWTSVRFSAGLIGYAGGTVVAIFSPGVALAIFGLIAVYYLFEHLPEPPGDDPAQASQSDAGPAEAGPPAAGPPAAGPPAAGAAKAAAPEAASKQRDYGVGAWAGRVGSQMRTRVPWLSQDSSVACPPWAVAIACTIDSPSPLPPPSE